MSVFLMVNCTRLLPLTVYNPPGTYGAGDKFEVIITVVPGFRSIVDSVTTFRSSCGVVFSPGAITASLWIGLSHFAIASIPLGKNVTELSLTLIIAPLTLRKSVPSISSEESFLVTCILIGLFLVGCGKSSSTSNIAL